MSQPRAFGRWLPRNDFEGDDRLANFATCMDTAAGRAVAWATNGRLDYDGQVYRDSVHPHDPDGINLVQAAAEVHKVAGLELVIKRGWPLANVKTHLRYGRGLVITGWYDTIPRAFRHQASAHFTHAMWCSHRSATTGNVRTWDPLNPAVHEYGRWIPAEIIWAFMETLNRDCGYVPLEVA